MTDAGEVTTYLPVTGDAAQVAQAACARAGITVCSLDTLAATQEAEALYETVWRTTDPPVSAEQMRAIEHAVADAVGKFVRVAFGDGF